MGGLQVLPRSRRGWSRGRRPPSVATPKGQCAPRGRRPPSVATPKGQCAPRGRRPPSVAAPKHQCAPRGRRPPSVATSKGQCAPRGRRPPSVATPKGQCAPRGRRPPSVATTRMCGSCTRTLLNLLLTNSLHSKATDITQNTSLLINEDKIGLPSPWENECTPSTYFDFVSSISVFVPLFFMLHTEKFLLLYIKCYYYYIYTFAADCE